MSASNDKKSDFERDSIRQNLNRYLILTSNIYQNQKRYNFSKFIYNIKL